MGDIRLTIRKKRLYDKKRRNRKILLGFIVVPLFTIAVGFGLTKKLIIPYLNKDLVATNNLEKENLNESELGQISLYNIEIGGFKDLEDAEGLLSKLNEEGIFAYVSKLDDYVVYSSLSFEKKNPEDQINKIKENHPEAEINSINIDSKKVRVEEDEKELLNKVISTADLLNDSYRTETKLWLSDMRNTDFRKIRTEIEDNNEKASKSMKEYSEIFLSEEVNSEELKTLYLMLSQNVETREQIVNEFHNRNLENAKKTYYDFIKTLFTFVNYHNM